MTLPGRDGWTNAQLVERFPLTPNTSCTLHPSWEQPYRGDCMIVAGRGALCPSCLEFEEARAEGGRS